MARNQPLGDSTFLLLSDIESAAERVCLQVRQGKGSQDRYTLLSPRLLVALRAYWRDCRPRQWQDNAVGAEKLISNLFG